MEISSDKVRVDSLDKTVQTRITTEQSKRIKAVIDKKPSIYNNESHFIRCAVIRLLRQEEK